MASVPFNNLITFSRGTNATLTGSNGLIQYAPNNLLTFSEQFDNAAWIKAGGSVTANVTTSPDGSATADKLVEDTSSGGHYVSALASVTTGTTYTLSVYVKAAGRSWVRVVFGAGFATTNTWFDIANGTVGTVGATSASIQNAGNGWYRVTVTQSATSSTSGQFFVAAETSGSSTSYTGNGTSGVFIWGAQLELGSTATSYNSTTVKNLLGYSEAFDNAAWSKTRASIVTGAQANPVNGAFNAQKLMEDTTASNSHFVRFLGGGVVVSGAQYTFSVYLKAAGRNWARLMWNGTSTQAAYFNLSSGTVGTVGSEATATITAVGSGWYRCSITNNPLSTSTAYEVYTSVDGTTTTYTGDGNSGVYIYGAQLSDSASLDPYVPTPGAAPSSTAYYGPRFDYDPVTLAPKGILVEEARTNGNLYSEDLSNAYWTVAGASLSGGNTAPSGSPVAYKLVENTANSTHQIGRLTAVGATTATAYTMSFYVKAAGRSRIRLYIYGFNNYTPILDLTSKTIVSAAGGTAPVVTFTTVSDGYIRITITDTTNASELQFDSVSLVSTGTTFNYTGDGVSGVILWGFQREQGSFATSYIPTIASTVTRSADIATITGSLFSQWYGQNEGSFVATFTAAQNTFTTYLAASNGVVAQNSMHMDNDGSGNMRVAYYSGSSAVALLSLGVTGTVGTVNILGTAYRANDFAASRNGGTVVSDTAGAVPVGVNRLNIGADPSGAAVNVSNGHIRYAAYYPVRLADFQLQALTELPLVPTLDLDFLNNLYEA